MAQAELEVTFKFLKSSVWPYVQAMCALTGEPLPVQGEVTNAQMHRLIRQTMNAVSVKYQRETAAIEPPEAVGA